MSINGGTTRPPATDPTAAAAALCTSEAIRNSQVPFAGGAWGSISEGSRLEKSNATPSRAELLPAAGQDMIGIAQSPYASASSKMQLQPGAAAAAAAAAAAIIRSNAATAAFTVFATQAARNAHAGHHATTAFRDGPASAAAAAALLTHSNAPKMKYYSRVEESGIAGAGTTTAGPPGMRMPGSLTSNNSGSRSSRGAGGSSGGGQHAGAAYCLIPQPAYDNEHRHRQQPPPPPPSQAPPLSRTSNGSSGHSLGRARAAVGPPKLAAGGGMPRSQDRQYQQTRRGGAAATMMNMPLATTGGAMADAHRFRGGHVSSSSSLVPDSHRAGRIAPRQQGGSIGDAIGGVGGSSERGDLVLSAHVRLERSREQNRQSSKKARVRRKGEEETLREKIQSIQLFRLMVEEAPDMMSIHGLDHRAPFRYASSAFQRVAGINPREVLGRGLTDLVAGEDRAAVQQALLKVVFSQTTDNIVSYRMLTPAGGSLQVETSIRTGDQCIICVARAVATGKPSAPLQLPPPAALPLPAFSEEQQTPPRFFFGPGEAANGSVSGNGPSNSGNSSGNDGNDDGDNSVAVTAAATAIAAAAEATAAAAAAAVATATTHNNNGASSTCKESQRDEDAVKGLGLGLGLAPSQSQTATAVDVPPPKDEAVTNGAAVGVTSI